MAKISSEDQLRLRFEIGDLFTPATPINDRELFAGRMAQVNRIVDAISQRGQHAILYGERGVGKTSLSNVLSEFLTGSGKSVIAPRVSVASSDSYSDLWRRILSQLQWSTQVESLGLRPELSTSITTLADGLPEKSLRFGAVRLA